MLVLFQEIPGCSGVRQFGREVLTHPALVRAIETEFFPVLVYNNRPGAEVLFYYRLLRYRYYLEIEIELKSFDRRSG